MVRLTLFATPYSPIRGQHLLRSHNSRGSPIFSVYLVDFAECEPLGERLRTVLESLPDNVQRDFLDDPRFRIVRDNFVPGKGWSLLMDVPEPNARSRCVVLRPKLAKCSVAFAYYVIAHELAHAYLRNGGWGEISDHEQAADALAAHWGYIRPADTPRRD